MKTDFILLAPRQSDGIQFWRGIYRGNVVCIAARNLELARAIAAEWIRSKRREIRKPS